MFREFFMILIQVLFILNIVFTLTIIIFERKAPGVTWAWVMIVIFIPFLGFIMYLLFGLEGKKYSYFSQKHTFDKTIQEEYLKIRNINHRPITPLKSTKDIIELNFTSSKSIFTTDNTISIYHEGEHKFNNLIKDINNAKSYIHIQYYILRNDELGRKLINVLANRALQNIEVKLLIDGMGSRFISKKILQPLLSAGGKVEMFIPPHIIKLNYRNHRKLCIIDGKIGYIGGFNIGNEYLGKVKKYGYWRDCHLRIEGSAALDLEIRFIMDWNYTSHNSKIQVSEIYFPKLCFNNNSCVQIVSSGPDTKWSNIHYSYIKMISEATKSIYIQTPYFVPDDSIFQLLRIAALSGVDVNIMIPAYPDHPFVYWAALSYLGDLIKSGVKCYKYESGFVHSKIVIVDSKVASVGTANMDIRSLKLNFEINAFIYSLDEIKILENQFIKDSLECSEMDIEWYSNLPLKVKVKESLCRLISPLL